MKWTASLLLFVVLASSVPRMAHAQEGGGAAATGSSPAQTTNNANAESSPTPVAPATPAKPAATNSAGGGITKAGSGTVVPGPSATKTAEYSIPPMFDENWNGASTRDTAAYLSAGSLVAVLLQWFA